METGGDGPRRQVVPMEALLRGQTVLKQFHKASVDSDVRNAEAETLQQLGHTIASLKYQLHHLFVVRVVL